MGNEKDNLMTNDKDQMSNQIQNPNNKKKTPEQARGLNISTNINLIFIFFGG